MGEALGDVEVVQHCHVLQGGQSRTPGLLHLEGDRKKNLKKGLAFNFPLDCRVVEI